jgi:hypothetical protein
MQAHPLQNLDKKLEKDVFSKLKLKALMNLLKFLKNIAEKSNEQLKKKN